MTTNSWDEARKCYLTSLRAKLKKAYADEATKKSTPDRRWLNGFMAAGFHSGLVTLKDLKFEDMTAFRKTTGSKMNERQEMQLERRLAGLCKP